MGLKKNFPPVWRAVILLFFSGCLLPKNNVALNYAEKRPVTIAVMPVLNETVDLDGPDIMAPFIYNAIQSRGYRLVSPEEVKVILAEKNINNAGEVFTQTYPELGDLLHADALLFCTITDWSTIYLVVYSSVSVEAKFELIDSKSGERLWDAEYKSAKRSGGLDKESMQKALINAALSPYQPQAKNVAYSCVRTLPEGPYAVAAPRSDGCVLP